MTALRCVLLLAMVLAASGCGTRTPAPEPDDTQAQSPAWGTGPIFHMNGNAAFFGGGTWGH